MPLSCSVQVSTMERSPRELPKANFRGREKHTETQRNRDLVNAAADSLHRLRLKGKISERGTLRLSTYVRPQYY